ncbi:MAG TPA: hypothetical protein VHK90_07295, partial [Thermoanaerobaculia bacterium]|nr:hypothetical protein [Thermoanaerobaculia bacterium]
VVRQRFGGGAASLVLSRSPDVVQRALEVEEDNGVWSITGRPSFRSVVRRTVIAKWNEKNPSDPLPAKANFTDEELAACHIYSWESIRTDVENYLNGNMTAKEFVAATDALYGATPSDAEDYDGMVERRDAVLAGPTEAKVKALCKWLNSATPNLRVGNQKPNASIGGKLDPVVREKKEKKKKAIKELQFDTPTKVNLEANRDRSEFKMTPKRTHAYSSDAPGGLFSPGRLSPESKSIFKGGLSGLSSSVSGSSKAKATSAPATTTASAQPKATSSTPAIDVNDLSSLASYVAGHPSYGAFSSLLGGGVAAFIKANGAVTLANWEDVGNFLRARAGTVAERLKVKLFMKDPNVRPTS